MKIWWRVSFYKTSMMEWKCWYAIFLAYKKPKLNICFHYWFDILLVSWRKSKLFIFIQISRRNQLVLCMMNFVWLHKVLDGEGKSVPVFEHFFLWTFFFQFQWPSNIVPYKITTQYSQQERLVVAKAINVSRLILHISYNIN